MMNREDFSIAIVLIVCLFLMTGLSVSADSAKPMNPNASNETKKVYSYLNSIQGKRMLSGHHGMYGRLLERDFRYIAETTGKYPALMELEGGIFAKKYHEDYANIQKELVKSAIEHWKAGGLVGICWHWGNPLKPVNTYPNTKIKFDIEAAFHEGTPEHKAMIKDLDVTAGLLKELQDAKVPVLFRPLHEICGGWFWWSMQGEKTAEKLWTFIYKYYTGHHKLNNILWVYSYSHNMRMEWFPGLEYADVIGVDIYKRGQTDEKENYDLLGTVAGNKPIALSECEEIPDPDIMKERGFIWNWFSTWHGRHIRMNKPDYLKRVYNHDLVITRDELPDWSK